MFVWYLFNRSSLLCTVKPVYSDRPSETKKLVLGRQVPLSTHFNGNKKCGLCRQVVFKAGLTVSLLLCKENIQPPFRLYGKEDLPLLAMEFQHGILFAKYHFIKEPVFKILAKARNSLKYLWQNLKCSVSCKGIISKKKKSGSLKMSRLRNWCNVLSVSLSSVLKSGKGFIIVSNKLLLLFQVGELLYTVCKLTGLFCISCTIFLSHTEMFWLKGVLITYSVL